MLKNRWIVAAILAGVVALGLFCLSWTPPTAATPVSSDADQNAFRGKVLLVRSSYFGSESYVVEQARMRQVGSQAFLVGKGVESGSGRAEFKGKTLWLNLGSITSIVECDDVAQAKKMLKSLPGIGITDYADAPAAIPCPPAAPPATVTTPPAPPK